MLPSRPMRRGLTLVELLVVLTILAILSTVAVTLTDAVVDQARYDTTVRTMQNIQDAIVGPANQRAPDGTILVTGFVADTGRLPATDLSDLISAPANLARFGLYSPVTPSGTASTTPVQSPAGWNGPYLTSLIGGNQFLDGWGNPITYDPVANTLASLGADNQTGGSGYDADIVLTLPAHVGTVQVQIQVQDDAVSAARPPRGAGNPSGTDTITLFFIGPNTGSNNVANPVIENFFTVTPTAYNTTTSTQPPTSYTMTVAPTIGPRTIWVSVGTTDSTGSATTKKSTYTRMMVRPTTNIVNLVAQY